jgi:hypothetical protein
MGVKDDTEIGVEVGGPAAIFLIFEALIQS